MQDARDSMPAVLDRQISTEKQDAFGHRHFAQALRSLVESEHHTPPFSIGLLGDRQKLYQRAICLVTRGLVPLGSPDGFTTRQGSLAEVSHGLPTASARRSAGCYRNRR